jgi:hypothetical protein
MHRDPPQWNFAAVLRRAAKAADTRRYRLEEARAVRLRGGILGMLKALCFAAGRKPGPEVI